MWQFLSTGWLLISSFVALTFLLHSFPPSPALVTVLYCMSLVLLNHSNSLVKDFCPKCGLTIFPAFGRHTVAALWPYPTVNSSQIWNYGTTSCPPAGLSLETIGGWITTLSVSDWMAVNRFHPPTQLQLGHTPAPLAFPEVPHLQIDPYEHKGSRLHLMELIQASVWSMWKTQHWTKSKATNVQICGETYLFIINEIYPLQ